MFKHLGVASSAFSLDSPALSPGMNRETERLSGEINPSLGQG